MTANPYSFNGKEIKVLEPDPEKNPKAISILEDEDGSWIGYTQKHGKLTFVREAKPEDALIKLITHP